MVKPFTTYLLSELRHVVIILHVEAELLNMQILSAILLGCAGPTPTGPESTFNYLIDAILAVPELRSMYMRRLRSIMDEYTNGKLAGVSHSQSLTPCTSSKIIAMQFTHGMLGFIDILQQHAYASKLHVHECV